MARIDYRSNRALRLLGVVSAWLIVVALASPAAAAITWSPAAGARTTNRPQTCNTPVTTCTDSSFTYLEGPPSYAISNDGSTHYHHAIWLTDKPSGDGSNGYVSYTTDCATRNNPATGAPPYCSGVYYARSADGGNTWNGGGGGTGPLRIGPGNTHVARGAIAVSGQYVHVAYVTTQGYWSSMCANAQRLLYVQTNTNYGAPNAWNDPVQLTSTGRVGYPGISASGSSVYVVATNGGGGAVRLHRSTDNGGSFETRTIGHTANTYDNGVSTANACASNAPSPPSLEGHDASPAIAAHGDLVGATWIRDTGGKVVAKVSSDAGATWPGAENGRACSDTSGPCTMHMTPNGARGPVPTGLKSQGVNDVAAADGRLIFGWKDGTGTARPKGVYTRTFLSGGGWAPPRLISCLGTTGSCTGAPAAAIYNDAFGVDVATYGTSGIGVAWAACPYTPTTPTLPCNDDSSGQDKDPGSEIIWKESPDNGATWSDGGSPPGSYRLIGGNTVSGFEVSEFPIVTYDKPGSETVGCTTAGAGPDAGCVRYVYHHSRSRSFFDYSVFLITGLQT